MCPGFKTEIAFFVYAGETIAYFNADDIAAFTSYQKDEGNAFDHSSDLAKNIEELTDHDMMDDEFNHLLNEVRSRILNEIILQKSDKPLFISS